MCIESGFQGNVITKLCLSLFIVLFLIVEASLSHGKTIKVPEQEPTIQNGINAAFDGDTVLVAPGTYLGSKNKNLDFMGKNIVLRSELSAQKTIIDCEHDGRGFYIHRNEGPSTIIDGFTIRNGKSGQGAGFFIEHTSPTIKSCIIINNEGYSYPYKGCGISCLSGSPKIIACDISNNVSDGRGAGIYCESDSIFMANLELIDCTISNNEDSGIFCKSFTNLVLTGCRIKKNLTHIGSGGGGIYCSGTTKILDCTISNNYSGRGGGGINCEGQSTICNTVITGNNGYFKYPFTGGGVSCSGETYISNCTVIGNYVNSENPYGGGIACSGNTVIESSIIKENWVKVSNNYGISHGGGIFFTDKLTILDSEISKNKALSLEYSNGRGGAIYSDEVIYDSVHYNTANDYHFNLTLNNCIISDNFAENGSVGGINCTAPYFYNTKFNIDISNCIITGNNGYALLTDAGDSIDIYNSTITYNDYGIYALGNIGFIDNSIIRNEGHEEWGFYYRLVEYSNIYGGYPGTGNIDLDPRFVDQFNNDFRLKPDSPCIDTANPTSLNVPWGGRRRDMGACEFDQGWYVNAGGAIVTKPQPRNRNTCYKQRD